MSDAKNINEVTQITTVESADYLMVSDISDDSLKRATVEVVGETLLGTTDISSIGDGSVTGAISDLDSTKLDNSGASTYDGKLTISTSDYGVPLVVEGNSSGSGIQAGIASGSSEGLLRLYKGDTAYYSQIRTNTNTTNRNIYLPDADGTIALTSDLPPAISSTPTVVATLTTDATTSYTTTEAGWYYVYCANAGTSGRCRAYMRDSSNSKYYGASASPDSSYVYAATAPIYFAEGVTFNANANFTGVGYIYKLT